MYTVKDLMTRDLVTLKESDDLSLADTIIHLGRIRHLPVVDRGGKLIGLVSQRDLLRAYARRGEAMAGSMLAGEVMTRRLTKVLPSTPLRRSLKLMLRNKFGCLPVVDKNGKLVGILTEGDLVKFSLHMVSELDRFQNQALRAVSV
ncbi:MAG: CBS domain-containing protein [Myxococcota bacterium]